MMFVVVCPDYFVLVSIPLFSVSLGSKSCSSYADMDLKLYIMQDLIIELQ